MRIQAAINGWLLYWPPPDDEDFRRLTADVADVSAEELLDFYTEWLPSASGVAGASVRLQEHDTSYTQGVRVWLNVAQSLPFKTARERLASVHATMWHEAAHVRHPILASWLDELYQGGQGIDERPLFAAFQALEDLRVERDLVRLRPQAAAWLRYQLGFRNGMVTWAGSLGEQSDCGLAMAATITAGRAVAGVIDDDTFKRFTRRVNRRLATEIAQLWDVWKAYSLLTDDERDAGAGDDQLIALARRLPPSV